MIACRHVGVDAGGRTLLDDLCLSLPPGEVTALVGPNGAGKSTLVSVLSGRRAPDRGRVLWGDRELSTLDRAELARRRAVMTQGDALAFPFRTEEVVLLGRHPHPGRGTTARDLEIALACLERAGAARLVGRVYTSCSGGERQRVQLARALAQIVGSAGDAPGDGRVLLLDEPTSALDLAHQHATLATAREVAAEGVAVLAVLHDLDLAAGYADRLAVLHRGRLRAAGPVDDVLDEALLSDVYGVRIEVGRDAAGRPRVSARRLAGPGRGARRSGSRGARQPT